MNRIAFYHLETLLWIARLGTFRAAADRLNTTQPAISSRMRELESQLGFELFRREGRTMALTVRGRQLVRDWEPLWSTIERTLLEDDDLRGAKGIVRIGSGEIAAASRLPEFVKRVEDELPGISLEISLDLTARLLQQLLGSENDIVFLAGPIRSPGIKTISIGSVRLRWLASRDTASRLTSMSGSDWDIPVWSLPRHSPLFQAMQETIAERALTPRSMNSCNNVRTLIEIVLHGAGIALLPETMVRAELRAGSLVEVLPQPSGAVQFEAAIRARETDPIVLAVFARAELLSISSPIDQTLS